MRELFCGCATLVSLTDAFTIDHTYETDRFTSTPTVTIEGTGAAFINGTFTSHNSPPAEAGSFSRRILRSKNGILRAYHAHIVVTPEHRHKHIATAHYTKVLRFYKETGVLNAFMEANQDGPMIWPGFAFQLVEPKDSDRLVELVRQELTRFDLPEAFPQSLEQMATYTPVLAALEVELPPGVDVPEAWPGEQQNQPLGGPRKIAVGLRALRRLYLERGDILRMTLWLDQPKPLAFLTEAGILSTERRTLDDSD